MRARDVVAAGVPAVYLRRLCDRGLLERVDRGLYRLAVAATNEATSLAEVSVRVPHATVALLSALQHHGLTSELPHAIWLLIDRRARMPSIRQPRIEVARASGRALTHGVQSVDVDGLAIRMTSPAKTVADCFRFRRRLGLDVALEATREYLRVYRGEVDALVEAARADRIFTTFRPYLEALV